MALTSQIKKAELLKVGDKTIIQLSSAYEVIGHINNVDCRLYDAHLLTKFTEFLMREKGLNLTEINDAYKEYLVKIGEAYDNGK